MSTLACNDVRDVVDELDDENECPPLLKRVKSIGVNAVTVNVPLLVNALCHAIKINLHNSSHQSFPALLLYHFARSSLHSLSN